MTLPSDWRSRVGQEVVLAKGEVDYRLVATKMTDLLDESVVIMMQEVEEALVGLDVEYDGWETSIENAH